MTAHLTSGWDRSRPGSSSTGPADNSARCSSSRAALDSLLMARTCGFASGWGPESGGCLPWAGRPGRGWIRPLVMGRRRGTPDSAAVKFLPGTVHLDLGERRWTASGCHGECPGPAAGTRFHPTAPISARWLPPLIFAAPPAGHPTAVSSSTQMPPSAGTIGSKLLPRKASPFHCRSCRSLRKAPRYSRSRLQVLGRNNPGF